MVEPQRIVPGAPPPAPLSKSQKKKRKTKGNTVSESPVVISDSTAAALITEAPQESDVVATELLVQSEAPATPVIPEDDLKLSPIVDLINKRLKASNKKISRITSYAATDPAKLNDDQKATLKTLPALEAVQKELSEVKKAVEAHESSLAREIAHQRIEVENVQRQKVADAVAAVETNAAEKISEIFQVLRLRSLLAAGTIPITIEQSELDAIFHSTEALTGEPGELATSVLSGYMSGNGDYDGVSYSHILRITHQLLNPPEPESILVEQEEVLDGQDPSDSTSTVGDAQDEQVISGIPSGMSASSNSFHFMQASELETSSFEWVEPSDAEPQPEGSIPAPITVPAADAVLEVSVHSAVPLSANGPRDWADADDNEALPSLPSLQAKFGTSGTNTPVSAPVSADTTPAPAPAINGHAEAPAHEDDGFTQARNRGDRGHGPRGGRGGGHRGDRGGFHHGGDRGDRRGGFRGGHRGRGEWRGDGERGRGGRGRGRGGPRETPTVA